MVFKLLNIKVTNKSLLHFNYISIIANLRASQPTQRETGSPDQASSIFTPSPTVASDASGYFNRKCLGGSEQKIFGEIWREFGGRGGRQTGCQNLPGLGNVSGGFGGSCPALYTCIVLVEHVCVCSRNPNIAKIHNLIPVGYLLLPCSF